MSNTLTPAPYTPTAYVPTPYYPNFAMQAMPQRFTDGLMSRYGVRLGWMKSHQCPCTYGSMIQGSPDPNCNTCHGRGFFWDNPCLFTGLLTFINGPSASPAEAGSHLDPTYGLIQHGEPVITIPYSEQTVWQQASQMDAYVEIDASARFTTVLTQGETNILPYQQGLCVESVYIFDPVYKNTYPADPTQYLVSGAAVSLVGFPNGTAYSVEFLASPVYLAWHKGEGMPHTRPLAAGAGQIPRRFKLTALDIWTRSIGQGGQNILTDMNGNPITTQGPQFAIATEGGDEPSPQSLTW